MTDVFRRTAEFNREVCGIVTPSTPTRLNPDRKGWTLAALHEEIQEFEEAQTLVDEVDALIDLIYFAAGRMQEMGVDGSLAFNEVQHANMRKVRGELSKRPGSQGYDAIKPSGWVGPNYSWLDSGNFFKVSDKVRRIEDGLAGMIIDKQGVNILTVNTPKGYVEMNISEVEKLP